MNVRILLDLPRTIDGQKIGPFRKGQELDMDEAQARKFIDSAMAEEVVPEPAPEEAQASAEPEGQGETTTSETEGQDEAESAPRRRRKQEAAE